MKLKFTKETQPDAATIKAVEDGLVAYNDAMAGNMNREPLWLIGRDDEGNIRAGLKGISLFDWLFVDWLWVAEEFRRQDHGTELLMQAEQIAKERKCVGIYLDTFSFQAPEFYAKHGYKEFGRMKDFPVGHEKIYLYKRF